MQKLLITILLSCAFGFSFGQGTTCANAISLPCATSNFSGTTFGALNNAAAGNCGSNYGQWYQFTGDGTETTISTAGASSFDHTLEIYSGVCSSLTSIYCSITSAATLTNTRTFTTTEGTAYFVFISYNNAFAPSGEAYKGNFTISRSCPTPPCAPVFTLTNSTNNCPANEFYVAVNVTKLGSASTVKIVNNGGRPTLTGVNTTGVQTIGPFPGGTIVNFIVENEENSICIANANVVTSTCVPCDYALPFCSDIVYSFPTSVDVADAHTGPDYGCLGTQPNPIWYYMKIKDPGDLNLRIQSSCGDVDYAAWGPFSATSCTNADLSTSGTFVYDNYGTQTVWRVDNFSLPSGKMIDCAYSIDAVEYLNIPAGVTGDFYMVMITNYANCAGEYTFSKVGGTGSTDCGIVFPVDFTNTCFNDSTSFTINSTTVDSVLWDFGDPMSGINNVSKLMEPKHLFSDTGSFDVTFISFHLGGSDTIIKSLFINSVPDINLGNDTILCGGSTLALNATTSKATYLWQDNSTDPTFNVSQQGTYWVTVAVNNCYKTDTIKVDYYPFPSIDLGNDTTLCAGATLELNATASNVTYLWQDNSTNPTFTASQQGTYWVEVSRNDCSSSDTILINYNPVPTSNLGTDTTLCQTATLLLDATTSDATYLWQDNSTNSTFNVTELGTYWVAVTVKNCSITDTINVNENPLPSINLGNDTFICKGKTLTLEASTSNVTYLWQDNSTDQTIDVTQQGIYWVLVTDNCGITARDSISINEEDCEIILELPTVFTPNNDGVNDFFVPILSKGIVSMNTLILNRWGNKIFETNDLLINWNAQDVTDGVYFWIVYYIDINGIENSTQGYVTVLK